ncbi:MAG: hypothetical protein IT177_22900 [Acidobacteria bacterium]|nr:hypothetical protein [Acidobacteriota bacterium]
MLRKRMTVVLVAAVCALALGRPAAQQRDIGGIGITVFEDRNFRGENATFLQDTPTLGSFRLDNRISSLRVGPGEMWEACEEAYFRGRCQVFSGTESDLGRVRWDNRISSLRRVQGGGGYQPPRPPMGPSAVLYRGTGYTGEERVITSAVTDLRSFGFDNAAQSVRITGGAWQLCEDSRFRDCRTVTSDLANLSSVGLSRRVSSLRPVAGGGGGVGVLPPFTPGGRLQFYDRTRFRGPSQTITTDAASLGSMAGRAESLRVQGVWQVCEAQNFTGQCILVGNDETDLARLGWRNRIRSARRMP